MGRHKTHLKVEGHRLYSNSSNKEVLILNRHSALDLSRNLVQNSRRRCNELSPQQKKALEDFRKNKILDFEHHDGYSRVEVLKAYFHFFDEMFFGSLRRWVELRYCYRKVGEVAVGGNAKRKEAKGAPHYILDGERASIKTPSSCRISWNPAS
jgi:hypothetical protein